MSRVGQKPVEIPPGVQVRVAGRELHAAGPRGELRLELPRGIEAGLDGTRLTLRRLDDSRRTRSCHGLARSLALNLVRGVSEGYAKQLVIEGVGFKAAVSGRKLSLWLGFSHPVEYEVPEGVTVTVRDGVNITVQGCNKEQVGDVAARVRSFFPAEPYQGKGIRYQGERIRRKAGKTVA